MSKTYWIARDGSGVYLCLRKPYLEVTGMFYIPLDAIQIHETDFPWIELGECIEVQLILKPAEGISTAQTKAAKRKRLEGRGGE